jgi:hypothetical protein
MTMAFGLFFAEAWTGVELPRGGRRTTLCQVNANSNLILNANRNSSAAAAWD